SQRPQELLADLRAVARGLKAGPEVSREAQPDSAASVDVLKDSDIFINCALIDDQPLSADQRGWVSQFQRHLEVRLEQLWGEPLKIGRYPMPAGGPPASGGFFNDPARVQTVGSGVSPAVPKGEGGRAEGAALYPQAPRAGG